MMKIAFTLGSILLLVANAAPAFEGVQRAPLNALISQHAKVHGVPEALVHRVIRLESNYNPYASSRGNFELMQIRHATARGMGYEGLPAGLLDAETNLTYGVPYLANAYRLAAGNHERAIALYKSGYYYEAKRKGLEGTLGKARPRQLPVTIKDARVSPAPATTVSPSSRVLPMSSSVAQTAPAEVAAGASGDVLVPPEPPRRPADFEATPTDLPTKGAAPAENSNRLIEPEFSDCLIQLQRIGITAEQASTAKNSNAACVIEHPVRLKSLKASGEQTVTFPDGPILGCRFAERFGQWVGELAVPLIRARVAPLSAVRTGPGFECRNRNHALSGKLSAHAVGQAVDIAGFELVTGETVSIADTSDLLRMRVLSTLRTAACGWFTTILGPGSDAAHTTHWHLDIQKHGSTDRYRICG